MADTSFESTNTAYTSTDVLGGSTTSKQVLVEDDVFEARLSAFAAQLVQVSAQQHAQTMSLLGRLVQGVEALSVRIDVVEATLSSSTTTSSTSGTASELILINSIAARLEALGSTVQSKNEEKAQVEGLEKLAVRLESLSSLPQTTSAASAATAQQLSPKIDASLSSLADRLAAIEKQTTTTLPALLTKHVDELVLKQDIARRRMEQVQEGKEEDLLDRLAGLESKIQGLPNQYRSAFLDSLEKQTGELSDLIKVQTEQVTAVKKQGYRLSLPPIPALPNVPDMGIAKRFSKLTGYLRPGSSLSLSDSTGSEPRVSSPLAAKQQDEPEAYGEGVEFEVVALYTFKAEYEDELEMNAGDVVTVVATAGRNGDMST
ncbi:hypothetical protein HDU99_002162, partial [Rhizoclosmatium hyalinum]